MGGLYCHHNFAKGCLALSRVVLCQSYTSAARSFVLVPALGALASWIPPSSRMLRFHSPLTAGSHFQEVQQHEIASIWGRLQDEELIFLSGTVSLDTLCLMVSHLNTFPGNWINISLLRCIPSSLQACQCGGMKMMMMNGVVLFVVQRMHKANEIAVAHIFIPQLYFFAVDMSFV